MAQQWCIVPGQSLRSRSWDGQSVLYNDVSGATHLLDEQTLELLHALRDGGLELDDWAAPELQRTLADLAKLYLVHPC
jgi:PqqD family protein of HPr-rel-A system